MDDLQREWTVTDEGDMEDLLGIEVERFSDGSIKLHQTKYINKVIERFLPNGPSSHVQRNSMPYSSLFETRMKDALALVVVRSANTQSSAPRSRRIRCGALASMYI